MGSHRTIAAMPPRQAVAIGLAIAAVGAVPVLAAMGVIESPDESFHVPRWLAGLIAMTFPAAGLWMAMDGLGRLAPESSGLGRRLAGLGRGFLALALACFFLGASIFLTWEAIAPFEGAARGLEIMGFAIAPGSALGGFVTRAIAAVAALIVDAILIYAAWTLVKGWLGRSKR